MAAARLTVLIATLLIIVAFSGCVSTSPTKAGAGRAVQNLGGSKDPFQRESAAGGMHFSHTAALSGGTSGLTGDCGREGRGKDYDDVTWKVERPKDAREEAQVTGMMVGFKILYDGANNYKVNLRILDPAGQVLRQSDSIGHGVGFGNTGGGTKTEVGASSWGQYKFEVRICYGLQLRYNIEADLTYD